MNASLGNQQNLLATYLRPLRGHVALLAALLLGGIGLELLNPQILRSFIDTAAQGGATSQLFRAALLFIGVALFQQLVTVAATYMIPNPANHFSLPACRATSGTAFVFE